MKKKLELSKGLEAYRERCEQFYKWTEKWIRQDEFDNLCFEHSWNKAFYFSGETYIFLDNQDLRILLTMVNEGLIDQKITDDGFNKFASYKRIEK